MAVAITWRNSVNSIVTEYSWGVIAAGSGASTPYELRISHDGGNAITNCGLYIDAYSGSYGGDDSAENDYSNLLSWGSLVSARGLGLDYAGTGPYTYFEAGAGDIDNPITLGVGAGGGGAGQINTATTATIYVVLNIPSVVEDPGVTAGALWFDQCIAYSYTS